MLNVGQQSAVLESAGATVGQRLFTRYSATSVMQIGDIEEELQEMVKSLDAVPPSARYSQLANAVHRQKRTADWKFR